MALMTSEVTNEIRVKGSELTLALAASDWQRAAGLTDEIHALALDLKERDRETGAREMMGQVFAVIANDLHDEAVKNNLADWDGRIKVKFGSSLHFGTDKRRWYYLTPSVLAPHVLRVEVALCDKHEEELDRQNRTAYARK